MINKKKLSEQIYEDLKKNILQQRIKFGEKLTNRGLQEKYGVSSTPVRDAINRLYLDGLLDNISNGGARVIPFDYQMAIDVNEVMSILSCESIVMAANRASPSEVVPLLEKYIQAQINNIDNEDYYKYDRRFHGVFLEFCGNYQIRQIFNMNSTLWELLVLFYHRDEGSSRNKSINGHEQILSAYKLGDIELARRYMKHHFDEAVRPFNNMLNKK